VRIKHVGSARLCRVNFVVFCLPRCAFFVVPGGQITLLFWLPNFD
jgi:hypothetical protein